MQRPNINKHKKASRLERKNKQFAFANDIIIYIVKCMIFIVKQLEILKILPR